MRGGLSLHFAPIPRGLRVFILPEAPFHFTGVVFCVAVEKALRGREFFFVGGVVPGKSRLQKFQTAIRAGYGDGAYLTTVTILFVRVDDGVFPFGAECKR